MEVIPSKIGPLSDETTASVIQRFYERDVYPDWWKLEPFKSEAAWGGVVETIERNDPRTRGILVLRLDEPEAELSASFTLAAHFPLVRGFAVGRTIFGQVSRNWMAGQITDEQAVETMRAAYENLCQLWDAARAGAKA